MRSDSLNLRALSRIVRRRRRLVVSVLAVFAAAGLCLDLFMPSTYRAVVRLEIRKPLQSPNGGSGSGENFQSETASMFTAAQLITNRPLLEALVGNLEHSSPVIAASWAPPPPGVFSTPWGPVSIARAMGRADAAPAMTAESDPQQFERQINWLQSVIQVEPEKDTRLVDIKVEHHNPLVARVMADRLARLFVEYQARGRGLADPAALGALDAQIQEVRQRIQAASASLGPELSALPAMQDIRSAEVRQTLATIGDVSARARADEIEAGARLARLQAMGADAARTPVDGDATNSARRELLEVQSELAAARQVYGEDHPKLISLKSRLSAVQARLQDETRREVSRLAVDRSALAARQRALAGLAAAQEHKLQSIQQAAQTSFASLAELRADQDLYARLVAQSRELRAGASITDPSVMVVQPAALEQPEPVRPHRVLNLLVCLLAGLLAGGGAALVAESLRRDLGNAGAAERALGTPVLAMVPRHA